MTAQRGGLHALSYRGKEDYDKDMEEEKEKPKGGQGSKQNKAAQRKEHIVCSQPEWKEEKI